LVELGGANRYETNVAVAQELVDLGVDPSNVIMVGGEGFSDALSVAPVAAAKGQILLLGMNNADYMKPVLDFVNENKSNVTVVGTKNVINEDILKTVGGTRVDGGKDRWDTNQKVLAEFKDTVKMDKLYVASAAYNAQDDGYADALVASALAGKYSAPLVLVDSETSTATANAINYIKGEATNTTDLNVIGGTGVVSDNTVTDINNAVKVETAAQAAQTLATQLNNLNAGSANVNGNVVTLVKEVTIPSTGADSTITVANDVVLDSYANITVNGTITNNGNINLNNQSVFDVKSGGTLDNSNGKFNGDTGAAKDGKIVLEAGSVGKDGSFVISNATDATIQLTAGTMEISTVGSGVQYKLTGDSASASASEYTVDQDDSLVVDTGATLTVNGALTVNGTLRGIDSSSFLAIGTNGSVTGTVTGSASTTYHWDSTNAWVTP
ncbi:MAG: cell wall-binding repeat-containing protein, partial [Clostridiaceae bacterium]|nr:cell wall-binding repeat-containing protein [Clostridiaceae bacterium]